MDRHDGKDEVSVLIAEDSRIQAGMLKAKLADAGFTSRVAEDGAVALDMIREQRPTLVISDIEMPNMTGYELCSAIKEDTELKSIPVILLSTLSEPQDIIRGLHCGADNYVTKPYDPEFLLARVRSILETPITSDDERTSLEVTLAGEQYTVKSPRQQVLNLLVSTFENAVEKNNELIRINEELTDAKEQLTRWNAELETLNERLESANTRMSRDLHAAAKVQQSLLPTGKRNVARARFAWNYRPCDELAGDFLNYFPLDDQHVAAFVVDVSGHGVASSLLSVAVGRFLTPYASASSLLLQQRSGAAVPRIAPPAEVAQELNQRFPMEDQNGLYFTMVYGVLNQKTLEFRYTLAGHVPIVHVPRNGPPISLAGDGFAIGWMDDVDFDEHSVQLQPGDRLYLYSDGIPEAMNPDHTEFGTSRLLEVIELGKSESLEGTVKLLSQTIERWCAAKGPHDDVSVLAIEIPGDSE